MTRIAEIQYRTAKAEQIGYRPEDEMFYSRGMIRRLLPYALDPHATAPPSVADTGEVNRRHAGKADLYGGWECSIIDIRRALTTLNPDTVQILRLTVQAGVTPAWLAPRLGLDADEIREVINDAIDQIQQFLGGPSPY